MKMIGIVLPLPQKALWPNERPNRWAKAKAVKQARRLAWAAARDATWLPGQGNRPPRWDRAETEVVFYFKTNRRRDADNAAASLKAYWDGIADAGVVANDSGFAHTSPEMRCDKSRPRVEITIRGETTEASAGATT